MRHSRQRNYRQNIFSSSRLFWIYLFIPEVNISNRTVTRSYNSVYILLYVYTFSFFFFFIYSYFILFFHLFMPFFSVLKSVEWNEEKGWRRRRRRRTLKTHRIVFGKLINGARSQRDNPLTLTEIFCSIVVYNFCFHSQNFLFCQRGFYGTQTCITSFSPKSYFVVCLTLHFYFIFFFFIHPNFFFIHLVFFNWTQLHFGFILSVYNICLCGSDSIFHFFLLSFYFSFRQNVEVYLWEL